MRLPSAVRCLCLLSPFALVALPACFGKVALEPGSYGCNDSENSVVEVDGMPDTAEEVGSGLLVVRGSGSSLTADYSGWFNATWQLALEGGDFASLEGQTFPDPCDNDHTDYPADVATSTLTSGSLSYDGTTITITASGRVSGGNCPGQTSTVTITCSKALLGRPGYPGQN
jgi:hypothetical protein